MWYFAWLLGVLLALAFGIINVMWYESEQCPTAATDDPTC
jgi:cytochrome bd-I ubiquinol oxidase subunit X